MSSPRTGVLFKRTVNETQPSAEDGEAELMRAVDKNQKDPLSELKRLDETELKAAIKSAWRKTECLSRHDLGVLLHMLKLTLQSQSREQAVGFGDWVEANLRTSRRTAARWVDEIQRRESSADDE